MANSADPDQFRSHLIWIYTICKDRVYLGSAGLGLINILSYFSIEIIILLVVIEIDWDHSNKYTSQHVFTEKYGKYLSLGFDWKKRVNIGSHDWHLAF